MQSGTEHTQIDLRNPHTVKARRPVLVAHRGGVITPASPENSPAAIRLAAEQGYAMVELDAIEAKDGEPVIFHEWESTGSLFTNCGIDDFVYNRTADELCRIFYRASDQHIAGLNEALQLCKTLQLGVMLDIKVLPGRDPSQHFFERIADLVSEYELANACVTISTHPLAHKYLAGKALFKVSADEMAQLRRGGRLVLQDRFWFGLPEHLPSDLVPLLQQSGAYVIPAINTFRYPPHAFMQLAHEDILRLQAAGVDGFQIDSIYRALFAG